MMESSVDKPLLWTYSENQPNNIDNDRGSLPADFFEIIRQHFNPVSWRDLDKNPELGPKVSGALVIPPHARKFVEQWPMMPNLKVLGSPSRGYNHLDLKKMSDLGIKVATDPGTSESSVADLGMSLLLASARNLVSGARKAMGPDPPEFRLNDLGVEVHGKTLGIVGMGSIGLRLAKRAQAFEMVILYHNRSRREKEEREVNARYYGSLNEMLPLCDFVVIICPLTPQTEKLFGEKEFRLMKNSATIVNIARGQIIDQDALVSALRGDELRAAALDVTYPEPLPRGHPLLACGDRVIITPHYGSATTETRRKMAQCMVDNLRAVLIDGKDRMPNQVN